MKALIIDDDNDILTILDHHLKSIGYQTQTAATAETILKTISEGQFDLILVDWMMPEVDGITVIKAIRSRDRFLKQRTPVIMVTSINSNEAKDYAQKSGADAYLPKSENPQTFQQELIKTIRTVVNAQAAY